MRCVVDARCIINIIIISINMTKSVADTIREFQIQNKFRNATEIRKPILLSAQGTIPDWLNGVLYRIGKYNNRDEMLCSTLMTNGCWIYRSCKVQFE